MTQKYSDEGMIRCDYCEENAMVNYQRDWIRYAVSQGKDKGSVYGKPTIEADLQEPTGEDNLHLCADHEKMFLQGTI